MYNVLLYIIITTQIVLLLRLFSLASRSTFELCPFDLSPSLTQWNIPNSTWTSPAPALDSAPLQGALAPFLENSP